MKLILREFDTPEINTTRASFFGPEYEFELLNYKIDSRRATSVNYYKTEGRIASFDAIRNNNDVFFRLRHNYIHPLNSELLRVGGKIYTDDGRLVFDGVLMYKYIYDGLNKYYQSVKLIDMTQVLFIYFLTNSKYKTRLIASQSPFTLVAGINSILYYDNVYSISAQARKIWNLFPFTLDSNYNNEINYSGFPAINLEVFDVQRLFEKGDGTYWQFDDQVDSVFDEDNYIHRRISSGTSNNNTRLTFMFYEYISEGRQDPDTGAIVVIRTEKIKTAAYNITQGGQYQIEYEYDLERNLTAPNTYDYLAANYSRYIDTYFYQKSNELKQDSVNILYNDTYIVNTIWQILFTGTVAVDELSFAEVSTVDRNTLKTLKALLLLNNLTLESTPNTYEWKFEIKIKNKLTLIPSSNTISLNKFNSRAKMLDSSLGNYDDSLFEQFESSVNIKEVVEDYFNSLFSVYRVLRRFIFAHEPTINLGDSIERDNDIYIITEVDDAYPGGYVEVIGYGSGIIPEED